MYANASNSKIRFKRHTEVKLRLVWLQYSNVINFNIHFSATVHKSLSLYYRSDTGVFFFHENVTRKLKSGCATALFQFFSNSAGGVNFTVITSQSISYFHFKFQPHKFIHLYISTDPLKWFKDYKGHIEYYRVLQ